MFLLDVLTRYSAVALLLLMAVLAIRDGRGAATTRFAALACVSIAALLLTTAPLELKLPLVPHIALRIIDVPNIVFIWWLCLAMFQGEFKLRFWHWLTCIFYCGLVLVYRLIEFGVKIPLPPGYDLFVDIITLYMMVHLVYVTLGGRADDLNEQRRKLRLYFVSALIVATVASVLVENIFEKNYEAEVTLFRAAIALVLVLWALLWLTKFQTVKVLFKPVGLAPVKPSGFDPRDEALHKQLTGVMEDEKIYLEPSLSIRTLAERLKTPEHRLRALINQGLDYQNFSAFLNAYRIKAVKRAFADADNARIPVLTIAMDAGYNSLAPFNRAFLKAEGVTPTAYRQKNPPKSNQ